MNNVAQATYSTTKEPLYRCEKSEQPWPTPNMAANPCKGHADAAACNADPKCNYAGGGCYESFTTGAFGSFQCTLTPDMLADIHANKQFNPSSLDNGNPMFGTQCTEGACADYECVVGDKCTDATPQQLARQACASATDGGCCQVPPRASTDTNMVYAQDGEGAAYTAMFANTVNKYMHPPATCDDCYLRKGAADCAASDACKWEDGVCSAVSGSCKLGCDRVETNEVPSGDVKTKSCGRGHTCRAKYGA